MARITYMENQKNHWKAEISVTKFGVRKRRNKSFRLKRDAKAWAAKMEVQKHKGVNYINADMKFPKYFDMRFKRVKAAQVAEPTRRTYEYTSAKVSAYFQNVTVGAVSRENLQGFFNQLHLAKASMVKMLIHIRACLDDAVLEGTIYRNPARRIIRLDYDNLKTKDKADKIMSDVEYHKVRDYLMTQEILLFNVNRVVLMVIVQTGLRVGEALALRYDDIDFDKYTLTVDESYESRDGIIKDPKTEAGFRVIPITKQLAQRLASWQKYQAKELKARGIDNSDNFVMMGMHGLPMDTNVNRSFEQLQTKLHITNHYSTHMLRHTLASNLIKKGINIEYVARFLGHSSADITRNYYVGIQKEDVQMYDQRVLAMLAGKAYTPDINAVAKLA